ncbi:MAG TPA: phosphate/phosphite/phosphonate ABC transporter substrate-binding protein [Candidatus Binatia bacterium]|nr:phosphate/phosphite/phosphonate ABC transporter substrate-binding protein [Candidatus Binatia bacterium]
MQQHRSFSCAILSLVIFFGVSFGSQALAQSQDSFAPNRITLGLVSASQQQEITDYFEPFVTYLARKIFAAPGAQGRVLVVSSLPELARLLDQKSVDFYMESPYPTYVVNQVHGAGRVLLRRWKGGLAEYRSLIVSAKDSGIDRLESLRGKQVAFEDPESTSGYFLPKFFFQRNGFKLSPLTDTMPQASYGAIIYLFAGTIDKLVELVLARQVSAGAMSDDDFSSLEPQKKDKLNVLAQTDFLPRHLVSVRKDLSREASERLAAILQGMHDDTGGRQILSKLDNTMKFDNLPGGEEAMRRRLLETFFDPQRR